MTVYFNNYKMKLVLFMETFLCFQKLTPTGGFGMPIPYVKRQQNLFGKSKKPKKQKHKKVIWFPCKCQMPHDRITALRMHRVVFTVLIQHRQRELSCSIVKQEKIARNQYGYRWKLSLRVVDNPYFPDNYRVILMYNPKNKSAVIRPIHQDLLAHI